MREPSSCFRTIDSNAIKSTTVPVPTDEMQVNSVDHRMIENPHSELSELKQATESLQDQKQAHSSRLVASLSKIKSDTSDVSKNSRSDKFC